MTRVYVWHPIASCPLELIPQRLVERYGASFSVLCRPTTASEDLDIIGWETSVGDFNLTDNKSATWHVKTFEDWTFEDWTFGPSCFGTFSNDHQCSVTLHITLYSELKSSTSDRALKNKSRLPGSGSLGQMCMGNNQPDVTPYRAHAHKRYSSMNRAPEHDCPTFVVLHRTKCKPMHFE